MCTRVGVWVECELVGTSGPMQQKRTSWTESGSVRVHVWMGELVNRHVCGHVGGRVCLCMQVRAWGVSE